MTQNSLQRLQPYYSNKHKMLINSYLGSCKCSNLHKNKQVTTAYYSLLQKRAYNADTTDK